MSGRTDAQVRYGDRSWPVPEGVTVTFGRDPACDVLLPADDHHLSRWAGAVIGHYGYLVIRNDSASRALVLRPPAGADRVVEPGAATTSLPFERFDLVLVGYGGADRRIAVVSAPTGDRPVPTTPAVTVEAPLTLNRSQERVLAALCEPLLVRRGPQARPATYAQIGQRLGLQPGYVRNLLKTVRDELSGHGLPDLDVEDLARWAVRSGWVTRDQVEEL